LSKNFGFYIIKPGVQSLDRSLGEYQEPSSSSLVKSECITLPRQPTACTALHSSWIARPQQLGHSAQSRRQARINGLNKMEPGRLQAMR